MLKDRHFDLVVIDEAHQDRSIGDDHEICAVRCGHVEPAHSWRDRYRSVRHFFCDRIGVDLVGLLYSDLNFDVHIFAALPGSVEEVETAVTKSVRDRAPARLGVVASVDVYTHAHLGNPACRIHAGHGIGEW